MSQTNIPITQLAQLGLAERIVQEAQAHPEVNRQAAQQAAPQELKKQRTSVEKTDDSKGSRSVKAEKDGRNPSGGGNAGSGRKNGSSPEEEAEGTAIAPWSGNIVNVKV